LFDDLYDEPLDGPFVSPLPLDDLPNDFLANIPGMPMDVAKLMLELLQANGGRPLQGQKDMDRVLQKRPDLVQEAVELMSRYGDEPDFGFPGPLPGRRKKKRKK